MRQMYFPIAEGKPIENMFTWNYVCWLIHQRYFDIGGLIFFVEPGEPWAW